MARTKLAVALALASAIMSPGVNALGLGAIEVKSALNQPLDARIPLLPADLSELETLTVSLASAEAFQRAGVDRPFSLTRLKFTVVRGDTPFVRVSTEQPVKEPFLDFLVEADWASGRLIREFTLLLDPPVFGGPQTIAPVAVTATPADSPVAPQAAVPSSVLAPVPAMEEVAPDIAEVPASAQGPAPAPAPIVRSRHRPVAARDTLWKIAHEVRPDDSVSINQVMVALLRANPNAFIAGDMNRLKRGSVLQVPEASVVAAIDAGQANREVRTHLQRWRERAAAVAEAPRGRLQVVAPPERNVAQADDAGPELAAVDRVSLQSLQQELQTYRESSISLQAENQDLRAQVEGLKQDLARAERLLNLTVQQPVVGAQQEEAAASETAPPEAAQKPAAESGELAPAEPPAAAEQQETPPKPKAAPKPAPKPTPVVPETRQPSFFDDIRNLGMLGGAATAVLGLLYLMVRRRRAASQAAALAPLPEAETEPDAAESTRSFAEPAKAPAAEAEPAAAELYDLPPEGDALGEADVYLAYGRYDQARELLDKALSSEPENVSLRLKLLETLALLQDEEGFAAHARLLRSQVGGRDPAWRRALEMGRQFLPTDPLFTDTPKVASAAPAASPAQETALDFGIGFDLDEPASAAVEPPVAVAAAGDFSLDFELPEPKASLVGAEETEAEFRVTGDESFQSNDFLGLSDAGSLETPDFDLGDLKFDSPAMADASDNVIDISRPASAEGSRELDEFDELDDLDEAGVKLNLARAYVDMGDSEGARSLIDEVLAEGSSRQRQEAEELLRQIG
ncbi:MAG TPA: FimV/HubP family polar landmark protein [Gammaproteobacteria bacterium]|nr:FimV/HubP family polar landmark protein [Gammaproteobacteria bacterium]